MHVYTQRGGGGYVARVERVKVEVSMIRSGYSVCNCGVVLVALKLSNGV